MLQSGTNTTDIFVVYVPVEFFRSASRFRVRSFGFVLKNIFVHHVIFGLPHYFDYLVHLFMGDYLSLVFHFLQKEFGNPCLDIGNDLVASLGT